jgi:hypothetical protein
MVHALTIALIHVLIVLNAEVAMLNTLTTNAINVPQAARHVLLMEAHRPAVLVVVKLAMLKWTV